MHQKQPPPKVIRSSWPGFVVEVGSGMAFFSAAGASVPSAANERRVRRSFTGEVRCMRGRVCSIRSLARLRFDGEPPHAKVDRNHPVFGCDKVVSARVADPIFNPEPMVRLFPKPTASL